MNNDPEFQRILEMSRREAEMEQRQREEIEMNAAIRESNNIAAQNFLSDAMAEMTALKGNPSARKRLVAVSALDSNMLNMARKGKSNDPNYIRKRELRNSLQAKLYNDADPEANAEYMEAMGLSGNRHNNVVNRLREVNEMYREEEESELLAAIEESERAERNRIAAEEAAARAERNRRNAEATAERNRKAAHNAARRAFYGKKSRRAARKSRKTRRNSM